MKKYLITGLLILVPLVVTLWVLNLIVTTMDQVLLLLPQEMREGNFIFRIPGIGVVLTIGFVFVVGLLAHNIIGRKLVDMWENVLARIPIVRSIYSSVKQVSDTVLSPQGQAFRKAVLVEFPRKDSWAVGFIVGTPGSEVEVLLGNHPQTVFVPTAPNPTSGYLIVLDPSQIRELDLTVDEALKFHISLGVVVPGRSALAAHTRPPTA
ncbi:MAG TPA: DUF502 domain-containing protein [Burkholderiaceae bacterium]|nr:DUF502 domain-containing protein [Burkholderiaceae bacterium]